MELGLTKKELMTQVIERWRYSGMSKRKFCEVELVSLQVLNYWLDKEKADVGVAGFVPLNTQSKQSSDYELSFPSGVVLRISGEIQASWLRELVGITSGQKG